MPGAVSGDPEARTDAVVGAIERRLRGLFSRLGSPAINRRPVVLVTGPWLAGVSSVAAALAERLPQHTWVDSTDPGNLGPGDAPMAVVFVVSAAARLTESDCELLDAAAEHTDVVVAVVSKIDVHRTWRGMLMANRDRLAARAPRYRRVPWIGVAAAPELGRTRVAELVAVIEAQLADSTMVRRNELRMWESRLRAVLQRFDRAADSNGLQARVDALRERRGAVLRQRRQSRSERSRKLRGQLQQTRLELIHLARTRITSIRGALHEDISGLSRGSVAGFEAYARGRVETVVVEVGERTATRLGDVARAMRLAVLEELPTDFPAVQVAAPQLKSRRLETRLMVLLGVGFGLGVALTLSRLVAGLAPGFALAGTLACVTIGLAAAVWVVATRGLLHDRAVLDRWVGEATASLRLVVEQMVVSRVLVAESVLATAMSAREEAEHARAADQVHAIDSELREHGKAAARAAALRDRELPMVRAALDEVRAVLGASG